MYLKVSDLRNYLGRIHQYVRKDNFAFKQIDFHLSFFNANVKNKNTLRSNPHGNQ